MVTITAEPGTKDCFTDIKGLKVGQAVDNKVKTGVTVIVPEAPVAMGVDVRGGGPGTRDTNALDPTCLVEKVHGLVLSGGSVFGLAAADTVTSLLSGDGKGLPVGPRRVPVVPSAILFDLMNGGDKNWGDESPYGRLGAEAYKSVGEAVEEGAAGAGYGAVAGGDAGGVGTASLVTKAGLQVSALIAVNSFGSVTNEPNQGVGHIDLPELGFVGTNTTIGAVATNVTLDKAACTRLAIMAQDGLARTIRPIHTPFDGDTVFAMSTGAKTLEEDPASTMAILGTLAADCVAKAVLNAVRASAK